MARINIIKPKEIERSTDTDKISREIAYSISTNRSMKSINVKTPSIQRKKISFEVDGSGKLEDVDNIVKDAIEEALMMRSASWRI